MKPRPKEILERWNREHPELFQRVNLFRQEKETNGMQWVDWCFVPIAATFAAACPTGSPTLESAQMAGVLAALATWRVTQGVYRFDPTLFSELWETPIDDAIPVEVFYRLPEWCIYIETPGITPEIHGVFVHLEHDQNDGHAELRIAVDMDGQISIIPLHLKNTLAESLADTAEYTALQFGGDIHEVKSLFHLLGGFISRILPHILYLCSDEPDYSGGDRPQRPKPKKIKTGLRYFDPDRTTTREIGYRIGAAIRKYRESADHRAGGRGSAAPKAPHIRRAHFHTFLRGKNRCDRVIKWIPPIPVNVKGEIDPTVYPVLSS